MSFSILPFGPQKITSHLILGDKQLAWSAPPWPPCLCVCVLGGAGSGVFVLVHKCFTHRFFYQKLSCTAYCICTPWESLNQSYLLKHTHIHLHTHPCQQKCIIILHYFKGAQGRKNGFDYNSMRKEGSKYCGLAHYTFLSMVCSHKRPLL